MHAPVFYMQSYWWVWFPDIEPRILELTNIFAEGSGAKQQTFAPTKISRYNGMCPLHLCISNSTSQQL